MTFYVALAADVDAILTELGQAGSIKRTVTTGGGPSDPTGGTSATTPYPAQMAVFSVSDDRIDGTNILAGDFQVIVEALDIEITAQDIVSCSEGELTIKRLGKIAPAGVTVAYDMVCRG